MVFGPVLIIGAGTTGLAVAQGLQKAGIPYLVFDAKAESTPSPTDWPTSLHRSTSLLKSLLPNDLADRLETDAVVDQSLVGCGNTLSIFDGVNGDLVSESTADGGCLRLSRNKLRVICREGIQVKVGEHLLKPLLRPYVRNS